MAFDWSEYVELADWLTKNAADLRSREAAHRSASSRAYYCAFHAAMSLLVRRNEYQPNGDGSDHGNVVRAYQGDRRTPRRQIGTWLARLKDQRRKADYEAEITDPSGMATASVHDARQIMTYLATQ
jgi:uncharacterized protein (UPF0332 family)